MPSRLASRLALPALMVATGAISGLAVWGLYEPDAFRTWTAAGAPVWGREADGLWRPVLTGVAYCVTMWSALLGARAGLLRRVPLRTWRSAAAHVLGISVAMQAAFVAVHQAERAYCVWFESPDVHAAGGPPLLLVSAVAFAFAAVCASLTYAFDFYRRARAAEQAAMQAELSALRAQIDPHFLFNTLNAIAALVRLRPAEAEGVTERLADLFRYTLRASKHPAATLADEVGAARLYAEIEQVRFRDRMEVVWEIEPDVQGAGLPSLLLQPLVENAVKHGVAQTEDACAVLVQARRTEAGVELVVRDTGPGFDLAAGDRVFARGTGLANVRDRLRLHFGAAASFELLSDGVRLRFPYRSAAPPPPRSVPAAKASAAA